MKIEEARKQASELNNPAVNKVLEYVDYLEMRLADRAKISEVHREQFGELLTKVSKRDNER